jgi:phage N-6-adenine-methyltransferase
MEVHYSSKSCEWETPIKFFQELDKEFHFTLDVCASESNRKCESYFDKEVDGLKMKWEGVCWMNPPYGRGIGEWIRKAYMSAAWGATVVCLIPSRTDTKWFHDYVMKGEIRFIQGRLKFNQAKTPAPFPSMLVIFKPKIKEE